MKVLQNSILEFQFWRTKSNFYSVCCETKALSHPLCFIIPFNYLKSILLFQKMHKKFLFYFSYILFILQKMIPLNNKRLVTANNVPVCMCINPFFFKKVLHQSN